ncbi:helix-turn-helix domain-containing protein [Marinomonas sp. C1424]|uniref:Helix-turn-helix domain-containing protein n=1 Tax=Marinomonas transparens TaxID=2795388 RepID=A0A934JMF2_9GAMM|nr:helix-turn-helix domain-containing protein [Marinomonas transparens]
MDSSSQALAFRARIILECAQGRSNTVVAERLSTSNQTVCKRRSRFLRYLFRWTYTNCIN